MVDISIVFSGVMFTNKHHWWGTTLFRPGTLDGHGQMFRDHPIRSGDREMDQITTDFSKHDQVMAL